MTELLRKGKSNTIENLSFQYYFRIHLFNYFDDMNFRFQKHTDEAAKESLSLGK